MPAGPLRERVTFQRRGAAGDDGMGNKLQDFADLAGCVAIAARLTPLRASETVIAEGIQGRRLYQVVGRYTAALAGVNVGDRMVDARDATRTFNVKAPPLNTDERRRYLQVLVEQGGADG